MISANNRLDWWTEARFGMFIHWGLYAILAGEWKGQKTKSIAEWIMRDLKIPIEEYEKLARDFNPVKFDAEEWAQLAQDAGMRYLVITAKHHDGFCMFDSPSNPYNIVKQTPYKRDPMKALAAACNKRGIRMCFYYSQDLDWHAPGGGAHWEEAKPGDDSLTYNRPPQDFEKYLNDIVKPNLRELLTNYGPIGLIWFDVPVTITQQQSESLRDLVHQLQPGCLVSGRVGHGVGDYGSLGDNEHPSNRITGAWETPATLNDTWGFNKDDHNWKSLDQVIDLLVNCASKGVNYLLNVGPTAEGVIPQPSVDLLRQVGQWLRRDGEAIYGTQASPFLTEPSWGRVTYKGNTLYLLIKHWPDTRLRLYGLQNKVTSARLLGDSSDEISFTQQDNNVTFDLSNKKHNDSVSVLKVTLDGAPQADQRVFQENDSSLSLLVGWANLGGELKRHPYRGTEGWTNTSFGLSWDVYFSQAGNYAVRIVTSYDRHNPGQTGSHDVRVTLSNGSTVAGTVGMIDGQPHFGKRAYQHTGNVIGQIHVTQPGNQTITITAERLDPEAILGLKFVRMELTRLD